MCGHFPLAWTGLWGRSVRDRMNDMKNGTMKKICLIATGGTIACAPSDNGLMPALTGEGLAEYVPELKGLCDIEFVQLMQIDSSNMAPAHWQRIARAVTERYDEYDGFVVTHGTDTMAYTAAALYYMLENIGKPLAITGSQLPMEDARTDAKGNLLTAFQVAVGEHAGVYLAFDGHVICGNVAKKMCSKNFHAFYSINHPEAAVFDAAQGQLVWDETAIAAPAGDFQPHLALEERVTVLKLVPGTDPALLKLLANAGYRGIILETFGAGGVPTDESPRSFLPAIDYAIEKGVKLVCTTQCVYDGVQLETYEVGVRALQHGVVTGGKATVEALTAQLMLELAAKESNATAQELWD